MARGSTFDFSEFEEFSKRVDKLQSKDRDRLLRRAVNEIAQRYLREVIKITPVGNYNDGRVGGTLRRGWTKGDQVIKRSNDYIVEVINSVEYGIYVNYGHRTRNGGWVEGQFFVEKALEETERHYRKDVTRVVDKFLKEAFGEN